MAKKDYSTSKIYNIVEMVRSKERNYVSNFLNPVEQNLWDQNSRNVKVEFWGGYSLAERKAVFVSPLDDRQDVDCQRFELAALEAEINNFFEPTHRQVLGSLMHKGLNRDVIGDILINSQTVQMIVKQSIVKFILNDSLRINNNVLNFKNIGFDQIVDPVIDTPTVRNTIPSLRLDVFVAKVINTSRAKAQELILVGKVFVNFQEVNKTTYVLSENEFITVRGFGRIKLNRVIGRSKKGKIVIEYQKV
ncbi:YlmH/Sll1252 family protein [Xylocopilactobacillus apicola]|uniref:RNA-binding protein YlmH n=1 Tax=Xylocopilactobacillus apicola TaxID=2932184 RepID=A0AAU9D0U2_9LACO|nr:YlmH/Sll1252 family protein [Xylocopilactobacillus apicola]BDR58311.1 putative RNA-binding protein YlmH [Xylocopilactobacillus apicola]